MSRRTGRLVAALVGLTLVVTACEPTRYVYDQGGRLRAVTDPGGDTAVYSYDAAGNITGVDRHPSDGLSVIEFSPRTGDVGDVVVVQGTGFAEELASNSVTFNGVAATVTAGGPFELVATVPAGVSSGPITVTTPEGSANSSIDFQFEPSRSPSITSLSASVAAVGDDLTISGSGFAGDPLLNAVVLNDSKYATVGAAQESQLVVEVPPRATSGPLSVATPGGTDQTEDYLYVAPEGHAATDVEFTAVGTRDEPATVTINAPGKIGLLVFEGEAGQRVNLEFSDSTFESFCGIAVSLVDPAGTETDLSNCPILLGPIELTKSGRQTVVVAPRAPATGEIAVTITDVPADVVGDIDADGDPVTVDIQAAGQAAEFSFQGTQGQRIAVGVADATFASPASMAVSVVGPDGTTLGSRSLATAFLGPVALPANGTYRVRVARTVTYTSSGVTGSVTLNLYDVPPDITGPIVASGTPVPVDIGAPGQAADLSFTANAGDRVSLVLSANAIERGYVRLRAPDGSTLASTSIGSYAASYFVDTVALPVNGTYHVLVDPSDGHTGTITAALLAVPPDVTGTVTPGGAPVAVDIDVPGQNAEFTFQGDAGDPITLYLSDFVVEPTTGWWSLSVLGPDDTTLVSQNSLNYVHLSELPADGTYRVRLDPIGPATGSARLNILTPPADTSAAIVPGGDPVAVNVGTPGQGAQLTFDGTAGQRVTYYFASTVLAGRRVRLIAPDGTTLDSSTWTGFNAYAVELPADGVYRMLVEPWTGLPTGAGSLTLFDVPPDVTGTIAADGQPVTVDIEAPGQNAQLSFQGTTGQRVALVLDDFDGFAIAQAPSGAWLMGQSLTGDEETYVFDLPETGTYEIALDFSLLTGPSGWIPPSSTLTLHDVPAKVTGPIAAGGDPVQLDINVPGQETELTFNGTAGQRVSLFASNNTLPDQTVWARIYAPDGTQIWSWWVKGHVALTTLPQTGTYRLLIVQYQGNPPGTGSASLALYNVPPNTTGQITPGGSPVTVDLAVPGHANEWTFTGSQGQRVSVDAWASTIPELSAVVNIFAPNGTRIAYRYLDRVITPVTLPTNGTYRILVEQYRDASDGAAGTATLALYNVPADQTAPITAGGAPVVVDIDVPGQAADLTFTGTAGNQVTVNVANNTFPASSAELRVLTPSGSSLAAQFLANGTVGPLNLPANGTYRIRVAQYWDAAEGAAGTASISLANAGGLAEADADDEEGSDDEELLPPADGPALPSDDQIPAPPQLIDADAAASHATDAATQQSQTVDEGLGVGAVLGAYVAAAAEVPDPNAPVTHITGEVLTHDGVGLAGVTVSIEGQQTATSTSGAFDLPVTGVPSGRNELVVDGSTANSANTSYGTFVTGLDIVEGGDIPLNDTVWMAGLDTANTVSLSYPLTEDVVVTTPAIPGLEVRIPAGSEITDLDGEPVTEIGITPIPVDKPPFPLPETVTPAQYFTIQPGGATVGPDGFTIVYPNTTNAPSGAWFSLYDYSTTQGWYVAGTGEVNQSGAQIEPHDGTGLTRFTGALADAVSFIAPPEGPSVGAGGNPVDLGTGLFVHTATDMVVSDVLPIALSRTYRAEDTAVRAFGRGTGLSFDLNIWTVWPSQEADLILPNGLQLRYQRISTGQGAKGAIFEHTDTPTAYYGSRITRTDTGWDLTLKDGTTYEFGFTAPVQAMRDPNGNRLTIEREDTTSSGDGTGKVTALYSPTGRWLSLSYDTQNRISQATDHLGRTVTYSYDSDSRLATVTDPAGGQAGYGYDSQGRITTISGPSGAVALTTTYDSNGRVATQTGADGETITFEFDADSNGDVTRAEVTDPLGVVRAVDFDNGYWVTDTAAVGTPLERSLTVERNPVNRLVSASVDHIGRRTTFGYDAFGNQTSTTALAGTPDAVTASATYEPVFHKVASQTDPLGRTVEFGYDNHGNLTSQTGADGLTVNSTYDEQGRVITTSGPLGNPTEIAYDLLHRVTITDPLGLQTTQFMDPVGRQAAVTDPTGAQARFAYDTIDQLTTITDGDGAQTTFDYDADGNVTEVTDPRGNSTTYTYDELGRVLTFTDQVGAGGSYSYDEVGNPTEHVDRRGLKTTYTYDVLGRMTDTAFGVTATGSESTITYTYNPAGLIADVDDSTYGTVHYDYDALDRVTGETTPQGHLTYAYDATGQPLSTAIAGGPTTTYTYDSVGRLETLTQGALTVSVDRNSLGQITGSELPNGINAAYTYNDLGALTKISYTAGGEDLGDVSYTYDPLGRRSSVDGSLIETPPPTAMGSATYDAANRLTTWDSTQFTYDAAGNLTGDGTNTYTWDARGQLAEIDGPVPATFDYDPFGRRTAKTIGTSTTNYLYDGANITQETRPSGASANYLAGLGTDETLARTTANGTTTYLTDGQGSTVGLANSAGEIATKYSYDPFGGTTATGTADPNPFAYTGRELDETGLYYYRARYYQPDQGRFVSEDPLGYGAGSTNFYTYVSNDPANRTDASGLCGLDLAVAAFQPGGWFDKWFGSGFSAALIYGPEWKATAHTVGLWGEMSQAGASGEEISRAYWVDFTKLVASICGTFGVSFLGLGGYINNSAARVAGTGDEVSLSLRYKAGWTSAQRAAADTKVAALNQADLVVTPVKRSTTSAASRLRRAGCKIPTGHDVDHTIDLQLGGADEILNMSPIDLSVNRSLGAQIAAQIRGLKPGTRVSGASIC